MGCDIHLYVEKFVDGRWVSVEPAYEVKYYGSSWKSWAPQVDGHNDWENDPTNRDYQLFAFLANVRNGYGFAGVDTGDAVIPQVAGRGIPSDTAWIEPTYDDDGEQVAGSAWLGEHSFTHATLHELLGLPWDMEFTHRGVVNQQEYIEFITKGSPSSWCGDVSGPNVRVFDREIPFARLLTDGALTENDYVRIEWKSKPLENCSFVRWLRNMLLPLSPPTPGVWTCLYCGHMRKESDLECVHCKAPRGDDERVGDPRNIRVVMGFDS